MKSELCNETLQIGSISNKLKMFECVNSFRKARTREYQFLKPFLFEHILVRKMVYKTQAALAIKTVMGMLLYQLIVARRRQKDKILADRNLIGGRRLVWNAYDEVYTYQIVEVDKS